MMSPDAFDTPFSIQVRDEPYGHVVALSGTPSIHDAEELRDQLTRLVQAGSANLVLDLTRLVFIGSLGIGAILAALQEARRHHGRVVLVNPSAALARLFAVTRIDTLIPTHGSIEAARAALAAAE